MIRLPLTVGDQLNRCDLRQKARCLEFHQQATATEPASGAWNQKSYSAQDQAAKASVLPAR